MTLCIGGMNPKPVSERVAQAVQSVVVTMNDSSPSGFQINFNAERSTALVADYPILRDPTLRPFNRVVVSVTIGARSTVMIDGFITHQQLVPSDGQRDATFTVTGEDVSVLMDMVDIPISYPALGDAAIVAAVLLKWAVIGIVPAIIPPAESPVSDPATGVIVQNCTDRAFLNKLASNFGYIFGVRPGPVALSNIAYWGPPLRIGETQPTLGVDLGPGTNVSALNFTYDAMSPTLVLGTVLDPISDFTLPVATFLSTREPPFAKSPALTANLPFGRKQIYGDPAFSTFRAFAEAQGITDQSTDEVVVAEGTVDTLRYGAVLRAPGTVGMRGAGDSFDGLYYVKSVTHRLAPGSYTQDFKLTREGVGSTVATVSV